MRQRTATKPKPSLFAFMPKCLYIGGMITRKTLEKYAALMSLAAMGSQEMNYAANVFNAPPVENDAWKPPAIFKSTSSTPSKAKRKSLRKKRKKRKRK